MSGRRGHRWKEFSAGVRFYSALQSGVTNSHPPGVIWSFEEGSWAVVTNAPIALIRRLVKLGGASMPTRYLVLDESDFIVQDVLAKHKAGKGK